MTWYHKVGEVRGVSLYVLRNYISVSSKFIFLCIMTCFQSAFQSASHFATQVHPLLINLCYV